MLDEGLNDACHNSNQDVTVKKVDECYRRTVRASLRMLEVRYFASANYQWCNNGL